MRSAMRAAYSRRSGAPWERKAPALMPGISNKMSILYIKRRAAMEDAERLFKMCLDEVDKVLTTSHVVGEPMTVEGNTVIPLISIAFGFGGGGGFGAPAKGKEAGTGAGTGAGGGVRPVGVIIANKDGIRVEGLRGTAVSVAEKLADVAARAVERRVSKKGEMQE